MAETTARRNKRVDKLLRRIRQNVANNELRFRAHNKINHMTNAELADFMGERFMKNFTNLGFMATTNIKKTEEFVVGKKFQQRAKDTVGIDLYIWGGFNQMILHTMRNYKVELSKSIKLNKLKLLKPLHDTEMQKEVGHKPIKVAEFLPMLWSMLNEQKNGEEGFLMTNGHANIFHVEVEDDGVVAVSTCWIDGEWYLDAHQLDFGDRWNTEPCLFVPAI